LHLSGGYYEAGHMMYVHQPSLAKLKLDLAQFIRSSTDQTSATQKGVAK
jgi:carboxypeptidase C (cathepsin A)